MDRYIGSIHETIASNPDRYAIDEQTLAQEISKVYTWMFFGLLGTAFSAYSTTLVPELYLSLLNNTFARLLIMFAPLGIVFYLASRIHKMNASQAASTFIVYSLINGISLGTIFFVYNLGSIFSTFLVTSVTFLIMATYGYTTKTDLTKFSKLFMFALIGLIISSLINLFLQSTGFDYLISGVGVLIFTGLIAYDTQKIKEDIIYNYSIDGKNSGRGIIMGALHLYLDFINLFLFMLRFLGNREE